MRRALDLLGLVVLALGVVAAWRATAPTVYRCQSCDQIHNLKEF